LAAATGRRARRALAALLVLGGGLAVLELVTDRPPLRRAHTSARRPAPAAPIASSSPTDKVRFPRYNHVYGRATHNSYFTGRRPHELPWPVEAVSGSEERILDQLLHDGVRSIELDVHRGAPGSWAIFHTYSRANSRFATLDDALESLQVFHRALPRHEVVNIIIELKETWPPWPFPSARAFDEEHTIRQFDEVFRRRLGATLFTPSDLLARAPGAVDLLAAGEAAGWPTTDELRGKFIVNVLGNWSNNSSEWVRYATEEGGVRERVAFPLRSIFALDGTGQSGRPGERHEPVDPRALEAAQRNSIFWQLENLAFDPAGVAAFVERQNGVIRAGSAFAKDEQRARIARGVQLLQTDFPWFFDTGAITPPPGLPTDPRRRNFDPEIPGRPPIPDEALLEPGERIYLSAEGPLFRFVEIDPAAREDLETLVAGSTVSSSEAFPESARVEGASGTLRAESDDGTEWIEVGRELDALDHGALVAFARGVEKGKPFDVRVDAGPLEPGEAGEMLALAVENESGGARIDARTAARLAEGALGAAPAWRRLGSFVFERPVRRLGLAIPRGDVLFVGTLRRGARLRLRDLPGERSAAPGATAADLSVP
jgi:hypothetical protein